MKAYAKINIFLNVLNIRKDLYHDIRTIILPINLYDEVKVKLNDIDVVICNTEVKQEDNLAYKALLLVKERYNIKKCVKVTIKKNIPTKAGLGGASSDAAATLLLLNKLFRLNLTTEALQDLAIELGSDVPFFITNKPAIIEGKGESITFLNKTRKLQGIIIKPNVGFSTKEMYDKFNDYKEKDIKNTILYLEEKTNDLIVINDFEDKVEDETIEEIKKELLKNGASIAFMTGSGSSVVGIFPKNINKVYANLLHKHDKVIKFKTNNRS